MSGSASAKNRKQEGHPIEDHRWSEQETVDAVENAAVARQGITGILQTRVSFHHRFSEITHKSKQGDKSTETCLLYTSPSPRDCQ